MELELASEKLENGHHLVKNKQTNEPIAFIKPTKNKDVTVDWHPDFKMVHPEIADNILHRNFQPNRFNTTNEYSSRVDAVDKIKKVASDILKGNIDKDPVKTKYVGSGIEKTQYGNEVEMHHYSLHDDDDQEIGTLSSRHGPDEIRKSSDVTAKFNKEYLNNNHISDAVREAAKKKHPYDQLEHTLLRVRHVIDNRNKEPRFIGTQTASSAKHDIYKTKMEPEAASNAYEEHLKKTLSPAHQFVRHNNTTFTVTKPAINEYDYVHIHNVMSLPGELHHIISQTRAENSQYKKENKNIVEEKQ